MNYDINLQDKAFLKLATKVATELATSDEELRLEILLHDHPRYIREFKELQRELEQDKKAELRISALRIMLKTAKPKEVKTIEALKQTDPKQWEVYQDALEFMKELASREESIKTMKIQPMPDHVRKELLAKIKESRDQHDQRRRVLKSTPASS